MFSMLRAKQKSVMIGLLILVGIPFVFLFGMPEPQEYRQPFMGDLFGRPVSPAEMIGAKRMIYMHFGRNVDGKMADSWALDSIKMARMAESVGIIISDDAVLRELASDYYKVFRDENNKFSTKVYHQILKANHITDTQFREGIRRRLAARMLTDIMRGSAIVTQEQVREEFIKRNETFDVDYVEFKSEDIKAPKEEPAQADLSSYYSINKKQKYMQDEQIDVRYLMSELSGFEKTIKTTEKDLQDFYENITNATDNSFKYFQFMDWPKTQEANKDAKSAADRKTIYKPYKDIRDDLKKVYIEEKTTTLATEKMEAVLQTLNGPEGKDIDWAALAEKEHLKVAKTGFFAQRDLSKQFGGYPRGFDFSQAEGVLSRPVSTGQGVFVYKVVGRKERAEYPFEEVKARVKKDLLVDRAKEEASQKATDFRASVIGKDFLAVAKEAGLTVVNKEKQLRSTPLMTRVEHLNKGEISEVIMRPENSLPGQQATYIVLRLRDRHEPKLAELKEKEESIRRNLEQEATRKFSQAWRQEIDLLSFPNGTAGDGSDNQ